MTKEIKKVGLLKDAGASKKTAPAQAQPSQTDSIKSTASPARELASKPLPQRTGKLGLMALLACLVLLILIPKPELIVYRKMNIQAQSIYWPGFMGHDAKLLDSELSVTIDDARREMTLCFEQNKNCQKYHIEKQEGLVGVIKYLLR